MTAPQQPAAGMGSRVLSPPNETRKMMTTNETRSNITISVDGTWAGDGKLRDGVIEDCGAQFCDDNDASMDVCDEIEAAIAAGKSRIKVDIDGETNLIEWTITEAVKAVSYEIATDSFGYECEAATLDDAIAEAFDGEIAGIVDEATLREKFARYVKDGGWCWIEADGERVVEIGGCP